MITASKKVSVLALIPARSGSKSIRDKNIRIINGKPMLAHSIEHARASRYIDRVIVSTDSEKYARIAARYGAEVPFLRPASISGDLSTDLEVFIHALEFLQQEQPLEIPVLCVHLRPTYPYRPEGLIDRMIETLLMNPAADSIRSVAPAAQTPYKMWLRRADGFLEPVLRDHNIREAWNMPRQALPEVFIQNACVDIVRTSVLLEKRSMTGTAIMGYPMEHMYDIDHPGELRTVQQLMRKK